MTRPLGLALACLALCGPLPPGAARAASGPPPASSPALVFEQPQAEFGDVHQRSTVEHRFAFVNRSARPVSIAGVLPRAEGGTGEAVPSVVPPGGRGEIRVRVPVGDRLGRTGIRIAVDSDDPVAPRLRVGLSGFVESAYEPVAPRLDFGVVFRESGRNLALDLASREIERLEVRGIEIQGLGTQPPFVTARADERSGDAGEGVKLRAEIRPGAPAGIFHGTLLVRTNVPSQPELAIPFAAAVYEDVVPEPNPVPLGLARVGEGFSGETRLRSRSGQPFDLGKAVDPAGRITAEGLPCPDAATDASCLLLRLRGTATAPGTLEGEIAVSLKGIATPVPVRYFGVAASQSTEIRTLDLTGVRTELEAPAAPLPVPLVPAPPAQAPEAGPAGGSAPPEVVLRWQASKEEGVYGYHVLRSRGRLGPYVRVDRGIIRVPEGAGGSHSYVFRDREVAPGATYDYYLDLVTTSGEVRRFSGVLAKTVPSPSNDGKR
ncbi:MAG TPA: DUF1573 domain-containing protein [Thermoanaerobaculia bacterium]|nr:DUF1573 domain-containing protein [Thermoanaerobaculia bacterium]